MDFDDAVELEERDENLFHSQDYQLSNGHTKRMSNGNHVSKRKSDGETDRSRKKQRKSYESSSDDEQSDQSSLDQPSIDTSFEQLSENDSEELLADCGTIESITLNNFMCHDHFEITFNPRVNFVIGQNGSKFV